MRWSVRIARLLGIDIRIHFTFLLGLLLLGAGVYVFGGHRWTDVVEVTALVLMVFACVLLHEFGHALAAAHYDIETIDITLLPFGGLARLERMPEEPWQEMVVAFGGPLVNIIIILGLGMIFGPRAVWESFVSRTGSSADVPALSFFLLAVNAKLLLFNLIPAFPMDGGRMLRALLGWRLGHARATQVAVSVGQVFAVIFGLVGAGLLLPERFGPWNPVLVLIAFFVYYAGSQEAGSAQVRDLTRNTRVADLLLTDFKSLAPRSSLQDAVSLLLHTAQHDFPVCGENGRVLGVLARQDLIAALGRGEGADGTVEAVMRKDVPTVSSQASVEEAFRLMQSSGSPVLPVVDKSGRLAGLVTPDNLGEMMMVRAAIQRGNGPSWRIHRAPEPVLAAKEPAGLL